jgi:tight adherence protein C
MTLLIVLLALLIGTSVVLLARAAALPAIRANERLGEIEAAYGFSNGMTVGQDAERVSLGQRLAAHVGRLAAARMDDKKRAEAARLLTRGGVYKFSVETFIGLRVLLTAVTTGLVLWMFAAGSVGTLSLLALFAPAAAWVLPQATVRRRGDRRQEEIDRRLADLIDLLVVAVEAGLGFNASLHNAAERMEGPLKDELSLVLQEQRMGLDTHAALQNFLDRCDTPGVRSFVRSVMQGEQLGMSIGDMMRSLALEMRERQKANAEERAHKAPVKMLFPLVFLIFPSMLVVLLFPAAYTFLQSFPA